MGRGVFGSDPTVTGVAEHALRIMSIGCPLHALGMVLTQAFNGAGDIWTPTWLNLVVCRLWAIRLAWVLPVPLGLQEDGVFGAILVAFSTMTVASGIPLWMSRFPGAVMRSPMPFMALVTLACSAPPESGAQADEVAIYRSCQAPLDREAHVLVFTRTAGFRHGSIPAGVQALRLLGEQLGFTVEHTEDPARFTAGGLAGLDAVVFLNTTGDVLDTTQQAAFEAFVGAGGGYVGVHAAADTEYDWPWYGALQGAWFASHPPTQEGTLVVTDSAHPATRCLASRWTRVDEWYDFRSQPPAGAPILLEIDEGSYGGARMGAPHPMAWAHDLAGGRAFYTALGHTAESYSEAAFLDHLAGGVLWVLRGRGAPRE